MSHELIEKIELVFALFGAFVSLAAVVVKLTPSKSDDEFVGKAASWLVKILDTARTLGVKPKTKELEKVMNDYGKNEGNK